MIFRRFSIFIVGLAAMIVPARAASSFNIGSSGQTTFNSLVNGLTPTQVDLLTLTQSGGLVDSGTGVTFTDLNGGYSGLTVDSTCTSSCPQGGLEVNKNWYIYIAIPSTYVAASFDVLYNVGGTGSPFTVAASGFSSYSGYTAAAPIFVGAVTASGITGLNIMDGTNGGFQIDNFTVYSQGASTPEASTLALFGSGLILIGLIRRQRGAAPSE